MKWGSWGRALPQSPCPAGSVHEILSISLSPPLPCMGVLSLALLQDKSLKKQILKKKVSGTQEGNHNLSNRVSEKGKMCRDRVPEICRRVILSVCLNIKMHKHEGGPHKARQNNY